MPGPDHAPRARATTAIQQLIPRNNQAYALTDDQVSEYYTRGFIILRGVFDAAEMAVIRGETDRLIADADHDPFNMRYWPPAKEPKPIPAEQIPWKVDPCVDVSPIIARLSRDTRITDAVASLYGGYPPRLFKDKLILKPGGTGGNGLHQDYNWWQGFPRSLMTAVLAIDDTTRDNGCTEFWTGYQQGFLHENGTLSGQIDPKRLENEEHVYAEMKAGDLAFFTCLTPHAAAPNSTTSTRRALFLSYNDSRDGEHYHEHYDHFFAYMTAHSVPELASSFYWL